MFKEFNFLIVHPFAILSLMQHFVDLFELFCHNEDGHWCHKSSMPAYCYIKGLSVVWVLKNNKNNTIIFSWLCYKQVLCHNQEEILYCSHLLLSTSILDFVNEHSLIFRIFLLVNTSVKVFIITASIWPESLAKVWNNLWKRLRNDWFFWTLSVCSYYCVVNIGDTLITQ